MSGVSVGELLDPILSSRVAAEALRILLARAQLDEVMKKLDEDNAWDAVKEASTHVKGVTLLARYRYLHVAHQ